MEYNKKVNFILLGENAIGSIEAKADQQERLDEFTQDVGSGNYHIATDIVLPCGCIDGRCGCSLKPTSAGGSETLMVADDLTAQQFRAEDDSTVGAYQNMLVFMKSIDQPIGGHTGPHVKPGETSDCGANDKLDKIYAMIADKSDVIKSIATEYFGLEVTEQDHKLIVSRAIKRREFSRGAELFETLREADGEVDDLLGDHKEVLAIINKRFGTTLDRDAVEATYGPPYEAFNIDAWSFAKAAELISPKDALDEHRAKEIAMAYYNIATALVLCGPNMRVTVLE